MRGAVGVARVCGADVPLVRAGALLHDVGRAHDHGIGHLLEGMRIARERRLHPAVIRIIQRHVGAGLDEDDVGELRLPPGGYMPETLEEKIVAHCDNLIEDHVRSIGEVIGELRSRGYPRAAQRAIQLHEELSGLIGEELGAFLSRIDLRPLTGPCSAYTSRR